MRPLQLLSIPTHFAIGIIRLIPLQKAPASTTYKKQAFPFCGAGFVGFINGKRAGKTETKQHNDFKNAHKYSLMLNALKRYKSNKDVTIISVGFYTL